MKLSIRRALPALAIAALVTATLFACTWGKTDEAEAQTSTVTQASTFRVQAGSLLLRTDNTPVVEVSSGTTRYDLTAAGSLSFIASAAPQPGFESPIVLRSGDIVIERAAEGNVTVMRRIP
jgi:hypothetical protein